MSEQRTRVVIAGSGVAGLACACELQGRADVVLFERLPVAGGEHWDEPRVTGLVDRARVVGTRFALATQAIRWDGQRVTAAGPQGGLFSADVLVLATGHRPHTLSELGIGGRRVGGVVPVTVAHHLLRHEVCLGRRPAVIGGSVQAQEVVSHLLATGSQCVTIVALDGFHGKVPNGGEVLIYEGGRAVAIRGDTRITGLEVILANGRVEDVACDGLVLAYGRVPCRNVDGALATDPRVVFAHSSLETADEAPTEAAGRAAAEAALSGSLVGSGRGLESRTGGLV